MTAQYGKRFQTATDEVTQWTTYIQQDGTEYHNHPLRRRIRLPCVAYEPNKTIKQQLKNIQKKSMCIIFRGMCYSDAIAIARLPTLADRREALCISLFASMQQPNHKLHHLLPPPPPRTSNYVILNARAYGVPRCRTECYKISIVQLAVNGLSYSYTSITCCGLNSF